MRRPDPQVANLADIVEFEFPHDGRVVVGRKNPEQFAQPLLRCFSADRCRKFVAAVGPSGASGSQNLADFLVGAPGCPRDPEDGTPSCRVVPDTFPVCEDARHPVRIHALRSFDQSVPVTERRPLVYGLTGHAAQTREIRE